MRELFRDNQAYSRSFYVGLSRKRYGFWKFMGDIFMTLITGGFWLIWIFVREMRGR